MADVTNELEWLSVLRTELATADGSESCELSVAQARALVASLDEAEARFRYWEGTDVPALNIALSKARAQLTSLRSREIQLVQERDERDAGWQQAENELALEGARRQNAETERDALRSREVRWKEIESAPKDGTPVLLWVENGCTIAEFWPPAWYSETGAVIESEPTHWMPLPEPPADLLALEATEAPILDAQG